MNHMRTMIVAVALALGGAAGCGGDDDGGGSGADAAPECTAADPTPFMCPCDTADDTCDTAIGGSCFDFNDKGPHCTHECTGAEDCEAPSTGCNGMGVCKAP
jgi:hypothetical protein